MNFTPDDLKTMKHWKLCDIETLHKLVDDLEEAISQVSELRLAIVEVTRITMLETVEDGQVTRLEVKPDNFDQYRKAAGMIAVACRKWLI